MTHFQEPMPPHTEHGFGGPRRAHAASKVALNARPAAVASLPVRWSNAKLDTDIFGEEGELGAEEDDGLAVTQCRNAHLEHRLG